MMGATVSVGRSRKLPRILPTYELDRLFLALRKVAGVDSTRDSDEILPRPHQSTTMLAVALMVATGVRHTLACAGLCGSIRLTAPKTWSSS